VVLAIIDIVEAKLKCLWWWWWWWYWWWNHSWGTTVTKGLVGQV